MSDPTGHHPAPKHSPGGHQRPSFDRPSLFAGMEDDAVPEDTHRVRILSTLESTRHASRPNRTKGGRRTQKSQRRGWLPGLLWGTMGLGVVALMAGFVMVVQDGHDSVAQAHPPPTAAPPQGQAKPKPAPHDAVAAGPAVIETPANAKAPLAALADAAAAPPTTPPAVLVASADKTHADRTDKAKEPAPAAKPAAKPSAPAATTNAAKNQDEDVALLEAMFAHTGRKAVPAKPASPKN